MDKERAIELIEETINYMVSGGMGTNHVLTDEELINLLITIGFTEEELIEDLGYSEELIDRANALLN